MLLSFKVQNFYPFKEEVVFSMDFAKCDETHPEHLLHTFDPEIKLCRYAGVWGGNNSGKSSLLRALMQVKDCISRLDRDYGVNATAFDKENPYIVFEVILYKNDIFYKYGFTLKDGFVNRELLYKRDKEDGNEFKIIFDINRDNNELKQVDLFEFEGHKELYGENFSWFILNEKNYLLVRENSHKIKHQNVFKFIRDWFKSLTFFNRKEYKSNLWQDSDFISFAKSILTNIDFGFDSIQVDYSKSFKNHSMSLVYKSGLKEYVQLDSDLEYDNYDDIIKYGIKLKHRKSYTLPINSNLSNGFIYIFHLLPFLYDIYKSKGEGIFIIDDFGDNLLPSLLEHIFEFILDCNYGQFIFTTNCNNLMDLRYLRRDEIWLIERDYSGCSLIESLVDYKKELLDNELETKALSELYNSGLIGNIPFYTNSLKEAL